MRVAGAACGSALELQWAADKRALDFYDVKGDLESLFALTGAAGEFRSTAPDQPWLHPGRAMRVMRGDRTLGHAGVLHPRLLKTLSIDTDVYVFEFDLAPMSARRVPRAGAIARFPSVRRDLSFELPESVNYDTVKASVRAAVGATLRGKFSFSTAMPGIISAQV